MEDESMKKIAGGLKSIADSMKPLTAVAEATQQFERLAAANLEPMAAVAKQIEKITAANLEPMRAVAKQIEKITAANIDPMRAVARQIEKITAANLEPMRAAAKQIERITAANSTAFKEGMTAFTETSQAAAVLAQQKAAMARARPQGLLPELPRFELPYIPSPAETAVEVLRDEIGQFERRLRGDQEIGMRLVTFGGVEYYLEDVKAAVPQHVALYATSPDGNSVKLLQHYSQTNILLVALQTRHEVPRRIGFQAPESEGAAEGEAAPE